ncbi:MAG TPA: PAS domain-containing protein, partial [Chitinophagaceae bacterium]
MAVATRSIDYLQSILNAFKDLVFVFNSEGLIVDYLKEEESDKLYVPRQQFIGRYHHEVLPGYLVEKIDGAIAAIAGGEETCSFDYMLRIQGEDSWFTAVFSPVQHMDEPMYLCVIRDITVRRNSENTLQRALEQLEIYQQQMDMFFTQSLTGFFFLMLDQPVQWNETIDKEAALDYAYQHLHFTKVNQA